MPLAVCAICWSLRAGCAVDFADCVLAGRSGAGRTAPGRTVGKMIRRRARVEVGRASRKVLLLWRACNGAAVSSMISPVWCTATSVRCPLPFNFVPNKVAYGALETTICQRYVISGVIWPADAEAVRGCRIARLLRVRLYLRAEVSPGSRQE